jgi:hypothetical protein
MQWRGHSVVFGTGYFVCGKAGKAKCGIMKSNVKVKT